MPLYEEVGGYNYSLPKKFMEDFFTGVAFGNQRYTEREQADLDADILNIYARVLQKAEQLQVGKEKWVNISAGSPGCGKTTVLGEAVDPDALCLKQMELTYLKELKAGLKTLEEEVFATEAEREQAEKAIRLKMYNKWRPGSNAGCQWILAHLIKKKLPFNYGTTCSSPMTGGFLKFLQDHGYKIRIVHVTAPDEVRVESIKIRDKQFVQTTDDDIREKGRLVPQRLNDTFLRYADEIEFYYRGAPEESATLAATWLRYDKQEESKEGPGFKFTVHNHQKLQSIQEVHDSIIKTLTPKEMEALKIKDVSEIFWEKLMPQNAAVQ